jgi:hypothetical protein
MRNETLVTHTVDAIAEISLFLFQMAILATAMHTCIGGES